ncbi:hypothetical protein Hdeb2414_s0035g00729441 [Helianthus debilis subsp. tardiflorus]
MLRSVEMDLSSWLFFIPFFHFYPCSPFTHFIHLFFILTFVYSEIRGPTTQAAQPSTPMSVAALFNSFRGFTLFDDDINN